jgi:apolipoprotein N-acyltransferase
VSESAAPSVVRAERILGLPAWVAVFLGGALMALAFVPSAFWYLAPLGLLPFYFHLSKGGGFRTGFVAGLAFYSGSVYWIAFNLNVPPLFGFLTLFGAVFWLSCLMGLGTFLTTFLIRRLGAYALLLHPFLVIALDSLIESSEMSFPWAYLGATQILNPLLKPLASLGGLHALTLSFLLGGLILHRIHLQIRRREHAFAIVKSLALLPAWLLLSFALGSLSQGELSEGRASVDVLLVQVNMDPNEKWEKPATFSLKKHLDATRAALAQGPPPDLVIWPETAVATDLSRRKDIRLVLQNFCREHDLRLLTGANDRVSCDGLIRPANASFLFDSSGVLDVYHKVRLVPFGERMPGQDIFPFLRQLRLGQAEFAVGQNLEPGAIQLSSGDTLHFARTICLEENFGLHVRKMLGERGELIVNQTNDAWFRTSIELDQHLHLASLRCVETGRSLVRATNNGYSAWIDPSGKVRELLPKGVAGHLRVQVPLDFRPTFYMQFGPLLTRLAFLLLTWALGLAIFSKQRKRLSLVLLFVLGPLAQASHGSDHFVTSGTATARSLSMGGCFAASSQISDAHLYNPAALVRGLGEPAWTIQMDPLSWWLAKRGDASKQPSSLLSLKQLQVRGRHWALAFTPAEREIPELSKMSSDFDQDPQSWSSSVPTVSFAMAIDHRIRLGLSLAWHADEAGSSRRPSINYGALLRANPWFDVGVQAIYLVSSASISRRQLEQVGDGTINVGVAFHPLGRVESGRVSTYSPWNQPAVLVALDVRNVTQEVGLDQQQEVHFGVESRWAQIGALRGGVYWPRKGDLLIGQPRFSAGLGLRLPSFLQDAFSADGSLDITWVQDPSRRASAIWIGSWSWAF